MCYSNDKVTKNEKANHTLENNLQNISGKSIMSRIYKELSESRNMKVNNTTGFGVGSGEGGKPEQQLNTLHQTTYVEQWPMSTQTVADHQFSSGRSKLKLQ